jgi:hypothetical protein
VTKLGDHVQCPECSKMSRIVWISADKKRAGIQCTASHHLTNRQASKYGTSARPQSKSSRNMVFITDVEQEVPSIKEVHV